MKHLVWNRVVAWTLAMALAAGFGACGAHGAVRAPADPPAEDTTLGAGDEFEVKVFGEKDLSTSYQVAADGTIQFPFLGSLVVAGKETNEIATLLSEGLRNGGYLKEPQVSVFLTESNSKRVSVLGAVAKPGTLPIVPGMTLVQAVSQVGGFTALASKDDTVVSRRVSGRLERYRVPVSRIARGDDDDFPLRAGDIVFVPERVF
jgi:protein involved in polysaccharide export with SLBB domain